MQKKQTILVVASLLVVVLSVTLAYFTAQIIGKGKDISVTSNNLQILFDHSDGNITGTDITPGWSSTKKFTITNKSNATYKYDIVIQNLVNTFVTEGYLQYKITSDNNGYSTTDYKDVPKSETATDTVLGSASIEVGVTQTYTIEFIYKNDENVDQSDDMGKILKGTIFITESAPTLVEKLLEDNPTISTRTDFSTVFTTNTANTLYKATEDNTDVYYFAGQDTESTPINNWVKFGKNANDQDIYWRIIRTNADGSIRLLYHSTSTTAADAYIGASVFNTTYNDSMYVGYMYGTSGSQASNRTNENDSTIKTAIDTWYKNNLEAKGYTKYLSTTAIYCNDREVGSGTYSATGSAFYYAAEERLSTNKTPTYNCTNVNDKFTVDSSTGNGKLTYPIALMTADEISYAGGVYGSTAPMWYYTNSSLESSTGSTYWLLLSPYHWYGSYAYVFSVLGSDLPGYFLNGRVTYTGGVRPVVSLKSCVKINGGDGSASNPYTILETESGC